MKKRRLILGDYDTVEDGLFTLSACKITKGSQVQSFVSVPGRYAPIDTSTLLTDGQPYYGSAALDATLESSEGTRDERLARVSGMVNALDGRSMRIIHPDHPERYLVGRVQVRPEYNDPAHCAVRVSAVCEPWLYNAQETEVQANLPHAEIHKIGGVTYKDGGTLRSAPVTEVESVGVNLVDADERITAGSGYVIPPNEGHYPFKKGEYTFSFKAKNYTEGCQWQATIRDKNNAIVADSGGKYVNNENGFSFSLSEQATYIDLYVNSPNGGTFYDIMLNEGSAAQPYKPYTRNTLPIPEAVRPKHGINESVYDYIDLDEKQSAKRVGEVVFDGSADEQWMATPSYNSADYNAFYTRQYANNAHKAYGGVALCDKLSCMTYGELIGENVSGFFMGDASDKQIIVRVPNTITTAAEMRAWLAENPLTIYYELATPEITDISDLLSGVNTIPAEEGGTLTMVNPYGYEVPHEVAYYLDGESPQQVELTNAGRLAVVPVVTVKGEVTLSYGNTTQTLSTGTYTLPWLYLTPDKGPLLPASHIVTCSGGGSVTFTYREAVLAE